ncbi:MAG: DUF2294 family protein, partial [Nitrospirales bacterium]|nr:DUF2294 family protein [Nitrospirales bacterium]
MIVNQVSTKKALSEALCTFWRDSLGWNQVHVQGFCSADQIIASLKGTLSPVEQKMAATSQGRIRMKQVRRALLDRDSDGLCEAIAASIQTTVLITLSTIHVSASKEIFTLVFGVKGSRALPIKVG